MMRKYAYLAIQILVMCLFFVAPINNGIVLNYTILWFLFLIFTISLLQMNHNLPAITRTILVIDYIVSTLLFVISIIPILFCINNPFIISFTNVFYPLMKESRILTFLLPCIISTNLLYQLKGMKKQKKHHISSCGNTMPNRYPNSYPRYAKKEPENWFLFSLSTCRDS